jgi:phage FluMu gp28-like protein
MIKRETLTLIEFKNGSIIYCLPAGDNGDNLRGFTADVVVIDEGAYVSDEIFPVINPMLATTGGKLIIIGTPWGVNNQFYRIFTEPKKYGFSAYKFKSIDNPNISEKFLEREKKSLPMMMYLQEYEAEFVDEADSYLPYNIVKGCINEDLQERDLPVKGFKYYMGFDPSRHGSDDNVVVILEKSPTTTQVIYIKENVGGKSLSQQANYIQDLNKIFNFHKILIDETGMGGGLVDILKERGIPVEGVTFSIKSKEQIFNNLKMNMSMGRPKIPKNQKLIKQLTELKYEYSDSGYIKIYSPYKTGHDDYPTALALALYGMKAKTQDVLFDISKSVFE